MLHRINAQGALRGSGWRRWVSGIGIAGVLSWASGVDAQTESTEVVSSETTPPTESDGAAAPSPEIESGNGEVVESAPVPVSPPAPAPAAAPAVDREQVIDFCLIPPAKNTLRYQKQRLVLFDLQGQAIVDGPEGQVDDNGKEMPGVQHFVFKETGVHQHLQDVFFSTFPMERFHTVRAGVESPEAFKKKSRIDAQELINATENDAFVAYSLACADWVALPRVTGKDATWQQVKRKRIVKGKEVEYRAWQVSTTWELEMDVYQWADDGWTLVQTVGGSNGGLLGAAFSLAAGAAQGNPSEAEKILISRAPEPTCNVPLLPSLAQVSSSYRACGSGQETLEAAIVDALEDKPEPAAPTASVTESPDPETATDALPADAIEPNETSATDEPHEPGEPNEPAPEAQVTDEERALLRKARSGSRDAITELANYDASSSARSVRAAVESAGQTLASCRQSVDSVLDARADLRGLGARQSAVETVLGFAACLGLDPSFDLGGASAPGTGQLRSGLCSNVQDDVSLGKAAMHAVAICEGRVASERAILALQKESKYIEGWKLFAALQAAPAIAHNAIGISLGQDEGVRRGDMYVAMVTLPDGTQEQRGFGRIVRLGPGGDEGEQVPSQFKFRGGEAELGTPMQEHAQIGVLLGLRPQFGLFTSTGDLETSTAFGGAIEGGYNASPFVPIGDEFWSRLYISYAAGTAQEGFFSIELLPEATYYLAGRLGAFITSGLAYTIATKQLDDATADPADTSNNTVSGGTAGIVLGGGLDYALTPDWNLRSSAMYRQGLSNAELTNKAETVTMDGGTLSGLQVSVSGGYTF